MGTTGKTTDGSGGDDADVREVLDLARAATRTASCARGRPRSVLLDHDDFHWTLITEDEHTLVVQLARAKDLVGELLVFPAEIAYVQVEPTEAEGEWLFECIVETEKAREVAYHFVMAHEYDDGEHRREEKWTH